MSRLANGLRKDPRLTRFPLKDVFRVLAPKKIHLRM